MRFFGFVVIVAILFSFASQEKVLKTFDKIKVDTFTDFEKVVSEGDTNKIFLLLVFRDSDSNSFNSPLTRILKVDSVKKDISIYKCLARDFTVIKIYRKQLDALTQNSQYCDEEFKKALSEYDTTKSFLFISRTSKLYFYGARSLDSSKETIHDIVWVKFGP
jgi:hypothetical protein